MEQSKKRLLHVDVLSILFGLGTWLCVNGMWVELPLLVRTLPEGWNLPSYLSVIVQMANIGPFLYTVLNSFFPKFITEKRSIYFVMMLGLAATILLANFWEETTIVAGKDHSTALLVLVFFLASVDCSSRVLYLPFMSKFQEVYLTSYFIGEGLSGFVPSIVAITQGVGGNPECRNSTKPDGSTEVQYYTSPPRFSVDVFFYCLFAFTFISLIAFVLLNKKTLVKGAFTKEDRVKSTASIDSSCSSRDSSAYINGDVSIFELPPPEAPTPPVETTYNNKLPKLEFDGITQNSFIHLLIIQIFICFWANGVFPSIQSYSCLPYGNMTYHLAVTLSNMANPAVCFLAFFIPKPNAKSISCAAVISLVVSAYVLTTALKSPSPPFVGTITGDILLVVSWIVIVGMFTYVRVSVATILRTMGKSGLFWCGVVTQFGSALGALVAFFVVNFSSLFVAYDACS